MMDIDHQLEHGQAFQANRQTEGLLQRLHHPGVIDSRRPEQMYERTAGWLGRRFSLLDRWNVRYSSAQPEVARPRPCDFSGAADGFMASSVIPATIPNSVNSGPVASGVESASGPQQFRVRRQMLPLKNLPPGSTRQEGKSEISAAGSLQRKSDKGSDGSDRPTDLQSSLQTLGMAAPVPVIQRKTSEAITGETASVRTTENYALGLSQQLTPPQLVSSGTTEGPNAGVTATESAETTSPSESLPVPRAGNPEGLPNSAPIRAAEIYAAHRLSSPSASSLVPIGHNPLTLQRKTKPGSALIARELSKPGATSANGRMIWRKTEAPRLIAPANQLPPSHGSATMQRFAAESPCAPASSSLSSDAPPITGRSKTGTNISQVAEDVSRLLARQLVIERERRGRSL